MAPLQLELRSPLWETKLWCSQHQSFKQPRSFKPSEAPEKSRGLTRAALCAIGSPEILFGGETSGNPHQSCRRTAPTTSGGDHTTLCVWASPTRGGPSSTLSGPATIKAAALVLTQSVMIDPRPRRVRKSSSETPPTMRVSAAPQHKQSPRARGVDSFSLLWVVQ